MRCVVFGATGKTGRLVVDQLLAEGHDAVAVARDPRRVQPRTGLRVVAGDVTDGARPPRLTDGPKTGRIRAAPYLSLGPSDVLSRADLAAFLVSQLEDPVFLGAAPMVTTERP